MITKSICPSMYIRDMIGCTMLGTIGLLAELYITVIYLPYLHLTIFSVLVLLSFGFAAYRLSQYLKIKSTNHSSKILTNLFLYSAILLIIMSIVLVVFFIFYLKDGAF